MEKVHQEAKPLRGIAISFAFAVPFWGLVAFIAFRFLKE